ncbi:hypothetical protein [Chryseobacterium sp. Leaf394]|uniref:hypothetical protein n=1 Tax=Chryseobacterium sp. Leaf394 TaxID=1736361 RepID=UPI0006F931AE|nr:hypothetical protein [Chryseobacterium sp. Leaf394]KQS92066.1 hypothetical protein ASG21_06320 [Chryseobacterium sp. Leaf394]
MTDKNSLIGYLENLKNVDGYHLIAFSRTPKRLKDVDVIFSIIYKLYDYIIESLNNDKILDFSHPIDFWRERDEELNTAH